ncbi:beta-adaptin [Pichia californica]|uniref:AP complex subunit beta n=1 Tax=Pichia californica TaxID=460514 RepID=A0A9P6WPE1_9ASCO|nr:beta-adaptin [[Candida] californica]KAG0689842.1 beta-adaptin [[Candida] californica]
MPKKGENYEFRSGLVSQYADERKDTIQRVIAAMTTGKDVSSLFPDVLKNIATHDLEQKKLVYLYLMNYAKTNPELVILATNTFVRDAEDPNPLIRALAIRTMGCIRVEKMVDYISIPLKRTLKDDNPYVRKTAVICVAKLFELNSTVCLEQGFLDYLLELVDDSNQMVVANSVAALLEISKSTQKDVFTIDYKILNKLLSTLNECSEWGRVSILSVLVEYNADKISEVHEIIEKITPQLQHENPAVVLTSIKVLVKQLDKLPNNEVNNVLGRLSSPLCSLLVSAPEIQFVALKNIRILLEKYPNILDKELRAFFIKYNDPLYLKLEKIEIMTRISNDDNCMLLLSELREYAMEIDIDLVNRSINGIGQIAIKVEKCAKKSVEILYELFINRGDYVVEEIIIVIQNILRRYPKEYLSTIITVVADLKFNDLSKPESLSSYMWILGEYAKEIPHLEEKLILIVENFDDFEPIVQSSALSSIVKISLIKPTPKTPQLLQQILNKATKEIENADVRDKAYLYWRLLSTDDKELQKDILLNKLPILESTIDTFTPGLLEELLPRLGNLSSIFYKPASSFIRFNNDKSFVTSSALQSKKFEELQQIAKNEIVNNAARADNLLDFDDDNVETPEENFTQSETQGNNILDELNDLFSGIGASSTNKTTTTQISGKNNDIFEILGGNTTNSTSPGSL